jgi:DNA-binding MarR family transcriptional regulator
MQNDQKNLGITAKLDLFMQLAKLQSIMSRNFDSHLGGISMSEFVILYHINRATGQKMRRVDLAEKTGLTASGVTRLLLPMEKVHLIQKLANPDDGRVSLVSITPAGMEKLKEGIENAELLIGDMSFSLEDVDIDKLGATIKELLNNA